MSDSNSSSGGIGFLGLLTGGFIALKMAGYIGWSWWWVLSPLVGPLAVFAVVLACVGAVLGVATIWRAFRDWRTQRRVARGLW